MDTTPAIIVRAPAKVNLDLTVGGHREDGFHELANVYLAVSAWETITVVPSDHLWVTVTGYGASQVPTDRTNLAARAALLLAKRHGIEPNVHIQILKQVPASGGMGGGSADAAAALAACATLWKLGAEGSDLLGLAAELGSDVPFSLLGGAALGVGRGEILSPIPCSEILHFVFAFAPRGLATPDVYHGLCERRLIEGSHCAVDNIQPPKPSSDLLHALACGDIVALAESMNNGLQDVAISMYPELSATIAVGRGVGALAGMLCGTGSTIAFLTRDAQDAAHVARALLASGTCSATIVAYGPVPGPIASSSSVSAP